MMTADNSEHQDRIDTLRGLIDEGNSAEFHALIRRMQVSERMLLDERTARTELSAAQTNQIVTISVVLALVLMTAALAMLRADLARRRVAEQELQKSEAEHRALMEQGADAMLIVDSRAVCVDANARAAAIIGRPVDELRGVPLTSFVEGNEP